MQHMRTLAVVAGSVAAALGATAPAFAASGPQSTMTSGNFNADNILVDAVHSNPMELVRVDPLRHTVADAARGVHEHETAHALLGQTSDWLHRSALLGGVGLGGH
ncbi:hypothetical protein ACFV3R_00330 [Streptomyces sp. NPDC059740]|uniref:hypothetical protein n=1 Tax=Streptomyces sp. NPDC059740 TaxID=3346926 RepID=UPI00364B9641